jgi:hypothetical protein
MQDDEVAVLLLNEAPSLQDVWGLEAYILTYLLTYLLTPWSRFLLEKL